MSLPLLATIDDVIKISKYLSTKATGATIAEAKKVLGASMLDARKVSAFKVWGFVNEEGGRLKLTNEGRSALKNNQAGLPNYLRSIIKKVAAYQAVIERAVHTSEDSLTTPDVSSYWHDNFSDEVQGTDRGINEQAVCFFHVVQGAQLGTLKLGRGGHPTRVDLNRQEIESFVENQEPELLLNDEVINSPSDEVDTDKPIGQKPYEAKPSVVQQIEREARGVQRVFITHGKNKKIVEQLKEIVTYGKLTAVIAEEHETLSKPIPDKVMDDMRSCDAAIIHVASEKILLDEEGKKHHVINENVLIEIGAAMALYKHNNRYNFILLVESGVELPSNLQGLYQCRYEGDKLDMEATMKLLKAFNDFSIT
jgi:predicted nucleotide-binding protein